MAKKKAFALRVNEDMIKAIEKWAADEFRSTNGQIEWMLMQALKDAKREPKKKEEQNVIKSTCSIEKDFKISEKQKH